MKRLILLIIVGYVLAVSAAAAAARYNLEHQQACDRKFGEQAEWLGGRRCRVKVIEGSI